MASIYILLLLADYDDATIGECSQEHLDSVGHELIENSYYNVLNNVRRTSSNTESTESFLQHSGSIGPDALYTRTGESYQGSVLMTEDGVYGTSESGRVQLFSRNELLAKGGIKLTTYEINSNKFEVMKEKLTKLLKFANI